MKPTTGCNKYKYVLSTETLPIRPVDLEVIKEHTGGCYDSLGLCTDKLISKRNGEN